MRSANESNIVTLIRPGANDINGIVGRMAAELIRFEATGTESDAIRSLMCTRDYSSRDIATFVDDALAVARQAIVTAEMARAS